MPFFLVGEPFCNPDGSVYRYRYPASNQSQLTPNMPGAIQSSPQRANQPMCNTQQDYVTTGNQQIISAVENSTGQMMTLENSTHHVSAMESSTDQIPVVQTPSGQQSIGAYQQQQYQQTMLTQQQSYVTVNR